MPRLSSDEARNAEKMAAESEERFAPVPAGLYLLKLDEVEVSDAPGGSGYHYWMWRFKIQDEGYENKGVQKVTSLSPKAAFSMGAVFAAFGVPADTHTDELIGNLVWGNLVQEPHSKDPNRMVNSITELMPYEGDASNGPGEAGGIDDF